MADLFLDWGSYGPYNSALVGGDTTTIETGGVAVEVTFTPVDPGAEAFTFPTDGYVGPGEPFDPNSHLKLIDDGNDGTGAITPTATVVMDFSASDTTLYTDDVQNLSFRINDVDTGPGNDVEGPVPSIPELNWEDKVTVLAFDSEGNSVPVTLTPTGSASVLGDSVVGESTTNYEDGEGSVLVSIEGPVSRIEVSYANGGNAEQAVILSDVHFSTVDVADDNADPDAADDSGATTGTPVVIPVLENDTDPDGDTIFITDIEDPANGTALNNNDGTITYIPEDGFEGEDTFTYTIGDGNGGTDTATITVNVEPGAPRIDTDVFPVAPADQGLDPLDGMDEDPDPLDNVDTFTGTSGADVFDGGDDADTITGGGGDDTLEGGIDDDVISGGGGADLITDLQGSDSITGGSGNDTINAGVDTFSDYEGDDPNLPLTIGGTTFLSDPNPTDGMDTVRGNNGDDLISTGDDADSIDGGQGNDTIDAGIDDDFVTGNQGDDSIIGGHGSDTLDGGAGNDYIDGSNLAALEITDDIDPVPENDRDLLIGALGNDTLIGGDDDDTLLGGSGADLLDGGIDEDSINGGRDDDTLIGGQGDDTLNGGAGVDSIDGGADRDTIIVNSGSEGAGDSVDGGFQGDDFDTLDLTAVGVQGVDWRLVNVRDDDDGPGVDPNGIDGTVEFLDGAGGVTGTMDFTNIEQVVPCFTPGTLIATPQGERMVDELREGDRIITRDNGIQEICWIGRKELTGHQLSRQPHLRPILIQQGALGNGLPEHDLLVSPQHRVLVSNDKTALYFEDREVLAAAKHLTGLDGVDEVGTVGVTYVHFMCERHEVVLSNGAWTESFQPGDHTLNGIGDAQRDEILGLFPDLEHAQGIQSYASARRSLKKHEARLLTR